MSNDAKKWVASRPASGMLFFGSADAGCSWGQLLEAPQEVSYCGFVLWVSNCSLARRMLFFGSESSPSQAILRVSRDTFPLTQSHTLSS